MTMNRLIIDFKMVDQIPADPQAGILYVCEAYEIACHRCICGCQNLVYTPLGPAEWEFIVENDRPTLLPSIGSWNLACRSHYWIRGGRIIWAADWSRQQVEAGRRAENVKRQIVYEKPVAYPLGQFARFKAWALNKIRRLL